LITNTLSSCEAFNTKEFFICVVNLFASISELEVPWLVVPVLVGGAIHELTPFVIRIANINPFIIRNFYGLTQAWSIGLLFKR
jgi:hypothetical protein